VVLYTEFSWYYPDLGKIERQGPDLIATTLEEVRPWLKKQS
jgi:hypothetical protein